MRIFALGGRHTQHTPPHIPTVAPGSTGLDTITERISDFVSALRTSLPYNAQSRFPVCSPGLLNLGDCTLRGTALSLHIHKSSSPIPKSTFAVAHATCEREMEAASENGA